MMKKFFSSMLSRLKDSGFAFDHFIIISSADLTVFLRDFLSIINVRLHNKFLLVETENRPEKSESEIDIVSFSRTWTFGRGVPEALVMVPVIFASCAKWVLADDIKTIMVIRDFRHEELGPCDIMPGHGAFAFIFPLGFKTLNR